MPDNLISICYGRPSAAEAEDRLYRWRDRTRAYMRMTVSSHAGDDP